MFTSRSHSRGPKAAGFKATGFTLTEILCVVVILGIASAVILPQLGGRGDLKAGAAARVVMADLMFAQNRAISRQTPQYVVFDVAAKKYRLQDGSPMATITHPVNQKPYEITFGTGGDNGLTDVTLTSAEIDAGATLAFDELGAPYSYDTTLGLTPLTTGTIKVTCEGFEITISIEPSTGELTVTTP
jgi:prepilin-type N-terminal cleavage/methylation domain-containing protein